MSRAMRPIFSMTSHTCAYQGVAPYAPTRKGVAVLAQSLSQRRHRHAGEAFTAAAGRSQA